MNGKEGSLWYIQNLISSADRAWDHDLWWSYTTSEDAVAVWWQWHGNRKEDDLSKDERSQDAIMKISVMQQWSQWCSSNVFSGADDDLNSGRAKDWGLGLREADCVKGHGLGIRQWNLYKKNFAWVFLSKRERFWPWQIAKHLCSCLFCFLTACWSENTNNEWKIKLR